MPVASSISVLSRERKSKASSSRTADPSNLQPVMHQSKIAVETKCNSIKLAFLNIEKSIISLYLKYFNLIDRAVLLIAAFNFSNML